MLTLLRTRLVYDCSDNYQEHK